jgi:hypothetical protein
MDSSIGAKHFHLWRTFWFLHPTFPFVHCFLDRVSLSRSSTTSPFTQRFYIFVRFYNFSIYDAQFSLLCTTFAFFSIRAQLSCLCCTTFPSVYDFFVRARFFHSCKTSWFVHNSSFCTRPLSLLSIFLLFTLHSSAHQQLEYLTKINFHEKNNLQGFCPFICRILTVHRPIWYM